MMRTVVGAMAFMFLELSPVAAFLVGAIVASTDAAAVFLLTRTSFGRVVYAIGNRESVAYLSGINTNAVEVPTKLPNA